MVYLQAQHKIANGSNNFNINNDNLLAEVPNMDFMDFSMFPQDQQQALNLSYNGLENQDQYVPKAAVLSGSSNDEFIDSNMGSILTSNTNIVAQAITTFGPQDYKNSTNDHSYDSSLFNSDDLLFSQSAGYATSNANHHDQLQRQTHFSPLNSGFFNKDVHFVNGLLTPADNELQEIYSRGSPLTTSTVPTPFGSATNLDFNNHYSANTPAHSFINNYSPMTAPNSADVGYFSSEVSGQLTPQMDFRNGQLSSPLHSPKSGSFAGEAVYHHHQQQNYSVQRHNAKKISSTNSLPKRSSSSSAGLLKPSINKRSKTMSDLDVSGINVSNNVPAPIVFNPDVQNFYEWITVSEITPERYQEILSLAPEKKVKSDVASTILDSFKQKHIMKKLNIINLKIGSKTSPNKSKGEKVPRMNIKENPNSNTFEIICYTSSGYDTPVSEDDNVLCGLRHLTILKDHMNYKLHDEMASSGKSKKIKRPLNQWMLYRTAMVRAASIFKIAELIKTDDWDELHKIEQELLLNPKSKVLNEIIGAQPKLDHHGTALVISLLWNTENRQVKERFSSFAQIEKETHTRVYPNYKFNPQKRTSISK